MYHCYINTNTNIVYYGYTCSIYTFVGMTFLAFARNFLLKKSAKLVQKKSFENVIKFLSWKYLIKKHAKSVEQKYGRIFVVIKMKRCHWWFMLVDFIIKCLVACLWNRVTQWKRIVIIFLFVLIILAIVSYHLRILMIRLSKAFISKFCLE